MKRLAIIGGTGLAALKGLRVTRKEMIRTPYGEPSGPLTYGVYCGRDVVFCARHGYGHTIPPHKINYRANIWAMQYADVSHVIAVAAVGGISDTLQPGMLVLPDQIIDYTGGERGHTYFEKDLKHVVHTDFSEPYCEELRLIIQQAAQSCSIPLVSGGVYAATQGPRLETAAEINKLERDGCTVVGMTGMPETALAKELDLCYASVNVVANKAAGRGDGAITMEQILDTIEASMKQVCALIEATAVRLG